MVLRQSIDGPFDDLTHCDALASTNVAKNILKVIGNRTDKVHRTILVSLVALDMNVHKLLKSFFQQGNHLRHFLMPTDESHEGSEKNIRIGFLIDPIDNVILIKIERGLKIFIDCRIQLVVLVQREQAFSKP